MKRTNREVVSSMIWSLSERFMSQIVSVIVTIILTRLIAPADYGLISIVTVIITILNVFMTSGFSAALIQQNEVEDADYSTVLWFSLGLGIAIYLIVFLMAPIVAQFYKLEELTLVLRVLALKVPLSALNSVQQAYVSRHMLFQKFFISTVSATIVSGIVGITLAYNSLGVWALVFQDLINVLTVTLVLWFGIKWRPTFVFSTSRLTKLFGFGVKIFLQTLFNTLYSNIRSLLIGRAYSATDLAYYSKGNQYPNLIVTNVDSAVSKTIFPVMSREQDNIEKVKSLARNTAQTTSYIMSPILIGFMICADSIVSLVMTDKWLPAVPYVQIICCCLLIRPFQTAIVQAIKAIGESGIILKMDIPVRFFALVLLFCTINYGVIYIAISEIVIELLALGIYSYYSNRLIGYSYLEIMVDFCQNIIISVIMGIAVYFIGIGLELDKAQELLIQVVVGGVIYFSFSVILKNNSLLHFKKLLWKD
ncbi:TPA: lipopolysaccharide biosynthesis protein [Streptococcus suis]